MPQSIYLGAIYIIGCGMTGLSAGALFAEMGYEVHVLEAHPDLIGGHARSFEIEGFRFCAGPQYVWNFEKNQIGHRFLKFLSLDKKVPFDLMDKDAFERIIVGNDEPIDIPMGINRLKKAM